MLFKCACTAAKVHFLPRKRCACAPIIGAQAQKSSQLGCLFRYRYKCLNARDERNGKGGEVEIGGDIAAGEVYEDTREGFKGQGVGTVKELDALQRLTIGGARKNLSLTSNSRRIDSGRHSPREDHGEVENSRLLRARQTAEKLADDDSSTEEVVGAVSADAVDDIPIEKPSNGKQDAEEGEGRRRSTGEIMA